MDGGMTESLRLTRKQFLALSGMALATTAAAQRPERAKKRPNFLIVLSDDHMFRAVGYNNPVVKTPNMDRLAHEGMIFDRAYIATPICAASRASLLTGLFPQQHQSVGLDGEGFHRNVVVEKKFPTVAHVLAGAGYDTAFCGKSHLGPPTDYGFDSGEHQKDLQDDEIFAAATEFLENRSETETPFLLWVATHQPHIPVNPGPEWLDWYQDADIQVDPNFMESPPPRSEFNQGLPGEHFYRESVDDPDFTGLRSGPPRTKEQTIQFMRYYYAVISRLDHQIGALVDTLKSTGQYENTVIIYIGDNGYFLGNHGLGNKITMHEESARVPMFLHWAGLPKTGERTESLVSSLDIYPTLLDLAGVEAPEHLMGKSLVPLFRKPDKDLRDYVASECVGVGGKPGEGHRMVCTKTWKYILTDTNEEVLYNLAEDPYEIQDVSRDRTNRRILNKMRRHMREWMKDSGDTHAPPPSASVETVRE